jgi:hypothetical protein
MKKLVLASLIGTALSASVVAGEGLEKIDTTFADLDNDDNRYISREEADDDEIFAHFSKIDANSDMRISMEEFNRHVTKHPQHFDGDVVASVKAMKHSMVELHDTPAVPPKDEKLTYELHENAKTEVKDDVVEKEVKVETETTIIAKSEFDMMDINSDGTLTKAEASRSGVAKAFDSIDRNDDELISRTEYSTLQQERDSDSDE